MPLQTVEAEDRSTSERRYMAEDMVRILEAGRLKVAMFYDDAPPFIQRDENNDLTGIDVEIIYDIADKLGVDIALDRSAKTYDEVVQKVYEGKVDVGISALSDTLYRAQWVRFTKPYWSLRQALFINRLKLQSFKNAREQDEIISLLNNKEMRIGVIKGSSYVMFAKKDYPLAEIVLYETMEEAVSDTKQGKLIAFLYDEAEIMNWNNNHPEDSLFLRSTFFSDSSDNLALAVPWQNEHFLSWLNLYIDKAKPVFLKRLKNKYMISR